MKKTKEWYLEYKKLFLYVKSKKYFENLFQ